MKRIPSKGIRLNKLSKKLDFKKIIKFERCSNLQMLWSVWPQKFSLLRESKPLDRSIFYSVGLRRLDYQFVLARNLFCLEYNPLFTLKMRIEGLCQYSF